MKNSYLLLLVIGSLLFSGCANMHIRKGDNHYANLSFDKAIKHYERALRKTENVQVERALASSYIMTNQIKKAHEAYAPFIDSDQAIPIDYFNYGRVKMGVGEPIKAIPYFQKYLEVQPNDLVAQMLISSCRSANERFRDTTLYDLKPVLTSDFTNAFAIQEYDDGVVFNADKNVILSSKKSSWTGNSYLNLYYMEKDEDGNWLNPDALKGDINGPFHDGPATFTNNERTVYFTRSNYIGRRLKANENKESNLKIFKAERNQDEWTNVTPFPYNSDDYSVGHPTLSKDGRTMYFVSDMPGGFGGTDIYRTRMKEGKWTEPENLGIDVNTPGNEMFPYIHDDGSLYFSSSAHSSMGGLDVFITYENDGRWATPENLNYPINTFADDFAFQLNDDGVKGFVSSSRTDKDGMYEFKKNDPTFRLFGFAHIKGEETPVENVTVEITDSETGEVIKVKSGPDGKFKLKLQPEKEYLLLCTKEGCFARTDNIVTKGMKYSHDFYADFLVEEIVIDKPIVLENIYYDFDKSFIREDAAKELNKLAKLLKDNPNINIEMGSHTDARGSDNYNMILSDKRAMAAVEYLVSQGIKRDRLKWKGYGESKPVNECTNGVKCSEKKHQENRRTEFKVTGINKAKVDE
jgi:outer membrane protein OmpA-like peptidoglycan-associated protein